jgi:hypothetical protein
MPRVPKHLAASLGLMLFVSCADPMGMCGCPPSRFEAVIHGRVTDPAGAPVAGANVTAQQGIGACDAYTMTIGEATTGADGRYRAHLYASGEPRPADCVRAYVLSPAQGTLRGLDTVGFSVRFGTDRVVDSARVDLVLRAP